MALENVMRVDNGNIIGGTGGGSKNFQGTIEEWNALTTEEKKAYDHASIPDSLDGGVNFPASKVIMTGGENVEDALDELNEYSTYTFTLTGFAATFSFQKVGRIVFFTYNSDVNSLPAGTLSFSEVVPEKYRPAVSTSFFSVSAAGSYVPPVMLRFNSQGVIDGYNYRGAISSRTTCRFGTVAYVAKS